MSNFEDDLKQIDFEKRKVKTGVTSSLMVQKTWQPIAMEWFEKWKLYVNYSNNADDAERTAEVRCYPHF
jgi:hypothetical protein